jgi:hypothetical protein
MSTARLLIGSSEITGEGATLPDQAIGVLMARNPPRDLTGDYVQPCWLAWQARDPSSYQIWLSRQLPRIRNRAQLEVDCEITGSVRSSLHGQIRPTGQSRMLVAVPILMLSIGLFALVAVALTTISDPANGGQALVFVGAWLALLGFLCSRYLLAARRTYEALLGELEAAIGGTVVGPTGQ